MMQLRKYIGIFCERNLYLQRRAGVPFPGPPGLPARGRPLGENVARRFPHDATSPCTDSPPCQWMSGPGKKSWKLFLRIKNQSFPHWKQQKNHLSQPKIFQKTKN